jgi:hypothetical protein
LWPKHLKKHLQSNLSITETELQSTVATKPYVKMSRMSNQQKAEFAGDVFCI